MMSSQQSPTVRARRLGFELRRLREAARLTAEQVADHLDCSQPKISRIESGRGPFRILEVRAMIELYGATEVESEALLSLLKESKEKGWWAAYRDVLPAEYSVHIGMETEAASIRTYQSLFVPGLLQTESYARAVIRDAAINISPDEVDRRVAVRTKRQEVLHRDKPLWLWAILDEAVLRRLVGGREVVREQLRSLAEMSAMLQVTVQIIPFSVGAHQGMVGAFEIVEFTEPVDPDVVYVEALAGDLYVERESDVRSYTIAFDHLRAAALSKSASVDLVKTLADDL
jgi:transcriptional regulator with XRE-family HTH domain